MNDRFKYGNKGHSEWNVKVNMNIKIKNGDGYIYRVIITNVHYVKDIMCNIIILPVSLQNLFKLKKN